MPGSASSSASERHLPELLHMTRFYSGDAMGHWLWAYWLGRAQGVLGEEE